MNFWVARGNWRCALGGMKSLDSVCGALSEGGVRYILVGGHAVAAHGYPRATQDIDLVVELKAENAQRAIEALTVLGYGPLASVDAREFADKGKREAWRREKGAVVFQMVTGDPLDMPVDLFIAEPFDFEREFEDVVRVELGNGVIVPVVSRRTLLAMKRHAGRGKDLVDIEQLEADA